VLAGPDERRCARATPWRTTALPQADPRLLIRHKDAPGNHRLAQVNVSAARPTRSKNEVAIEYDLAYLRSWSLLLEPADRPQDRLWCCASKNAY